MFSAVLVANRGEIAVRIMRTLRALGIRSVAIYTDADRDARHVAEADEALRVDSYLDVGQVVAAAVRAVGAPALHPGYGFLSENASLAGACARAAVTFVGPPVHAIEVMGDKINAKNAVAAAGVPVVPGRSEAGLDNDALAAAALEVGLPVLLKPSAGGGGKGMRRVDDPARLADEIAAARRESLGAFGDDTLLVERWVTRPRHIEIQVFADADGGCVHLGERECSLQRRHQKIVEEAPSPLLDATTRQAMGASAVAAARAVGYVGAGTVEFIVSADRPEEYFFMEMNTRLQVEHPVTEEVTGLDLVALQLQVAGGDPLGFTQAEVTTTGHAIEARIYAEDPGRGFLPATGTVVLLREPIDRPGVRVDSALQVGTVVGTAYDPMLSKVIARGRDRSEAVGRLRQALAATTILGVTTNVAFLGRLLADPDVAAGRLDTELVERFAAAHPEGVGVPADVLAAAGLLLVAGRAGRAGLAGGDSPWDRPGGWRLGQPAEAWVLLAAGGQEIEVSVRGSADAAQVRVGDEEPVRLSGRVQGAEMAVTTVDGTARYAWARTDDGLWIGHDGGAWFLRPVRRGTAHAGAAAGGSGPVLSPMPGTVQAVMVEVGDHVDAGRTLVIVEAMKMEYAVTASSAGTVTAIHVRPGQTVTLDQPLADLEEQL